MYSDRHAACIPKPNGPHEQRLVGWVVRNRAETECRDKRTYREVVPDPFQFSVFTPGDPKRLPLPALQPTSDVAGRQGGPLRLVRERVDPCRFRFYDDVDRLHL